MSSRCPSSKPLLFLLPLFLLLLLLLPVPILGSTGPPDEIVNICDNGDTTCIAREVCQAAYQSGYSNMEVPCDWLWPRITPSSCDPERRFASLEEARESIRAEQDRDWAHGRAPNLAIIDILWFGEDGMYRLNCSGPTYPKNSPFNDSNNTDPTNIVIRNWEKPPSAGTYTLSITGTNLTIPILDYDDLRLEEYGVRLLEPGGVFQTKAMSVLGNFTYGYVTESEYFDYFSSFIWRENGEACGVNETSPTGADDRIGTDGCGHGARIEQHMDGHMVTTLERFVHPLSGEPIESFFIAAKKIPVQGTINEPSVIYDLEFAAIRLDEGVSLLVESGTIHTNDYLSGVLEESFPTDFGGDEVWLKNQNGDPAHFCFGNDQIGLYPPLCEE